MGQVGSAVVDRGMVVRSPELERPRCLPSSSSSAVYLIDWLPGVHPPSLPQMSQSSRWRTMSFGSSSRKPKRSEGRSLTELTRRMRATRAQPASACMHARTSGMSSEQLGMATEQVHQLCHSLNSWAQTQTPYNLSPTLAQGTEVQVKTRVNQINELKSKNIAK